MVLVTLGLQAIKRLLWMALGQGINTVTEDPGQDRARGLDKHSRGLYRGKG